MPSIALALSGGVDSALVAYLLKKQGYNVTAIFWQLFDSTKSSLKLNQKNIQQHQQDAQKIANKLNIPFKILDLTQQFQQNVIDYFIDSYNQGSSPNPCIRCNQAIKFGIFYDWAMKNNFDYIATGHYAQILKNPDKTSFIKSKYLLVGGNDQIKDQTYFLYQIRAQQLAHILFPIGHLNKQRVRAKAQKQLHVAKKNNSANICFLAGQKVKNYLSQHLLENPGNVVDQQNNIIGKHYGLWQYTIGQRQGFYINTKQLINTSLLTNKHYPPALYVIAKNLTKNELIVGTKQDTLKNIIQVNNLYWIYADFELNKLITPLFAKIRHPGKKIICQIKKTDDIWQIQLKEKVSGIAPGQSIVLYTKNQSQQYICLGGGKINYSNCF